MTKEAATSLEEKVREQEILIDKISTTLEVLLERRDKEKADVYQTISADIKKNVFPFIERMTTVPLSSIAQTYLTLIKNNLEKIVSLDNAFKALSAHGFTPTEMHIIELIKQGKRSKEIADLLNVSIATISFHRNNIRIKLGLNKRKENLFSYLNSLQN
ncbi:helix-turn-helix transcriptional regulator [uncultured Desulfosarcina sp.]|uniref:helix-turn-helix transcriptional regulator n=1 Tax=uncultured Desulfosarcina sp. TaxID=218289 RepID=UPI0029C97F4F|nr:helix-turn-helix transcriptional regulator [uncultured Desulfosarcina sp.]